MSRLTQGYQDAVELAPLQEENPYAWQYQNEDSSAFGRGVDQMQASLYGFATAIGQLTGFDALEEWGEDGVARNLEEMSRNPPEIHSWDDVDSLSDFGTYFLETLAEQAPQLLMDVALGLGIAAAAPISGGASLVAGAAGRTAAAQAMKGFTKKQLAQVGKKAKRMKGVDPAYQKFQAAKGKVAGASLDAANAVKGAANKVGDQIPEVVRDVAGGLGSSFKDIGPVVAGMGVSNWVQNTGESQMNFMGEGIEAPGTALLAGAFKAGLDTLAPAKLLGIANKANVPVEALPQVFAKVAKNAGGTAMLEGGTEAVQTIVDHAAMNIHNPDFEMFDEAAMSEIWTAATKGAIVGGSLGGVTTGIQAGLEHRRSKDEILNGADEDLRAAAGQLDAEAERQRYEDILAAERMAADTQEQPPEMEPESQDTIDAQAEAVNNPTSTKDTVEVTSGSPMPTVEIEGGIEVETENGLAITTNPEKAQLIAETGGDEETMGQVLFNAPGGKQKANGEVVVAMDERGRPIFERATNDEDKQADIEEAQRQAPEGGDVQLDNVENVVAARMANSGDKVTVYGDTTPVIPLAEMDSTKESVSGEQREAGQERLNESALLGAVNSVFKDEKPRALALSILSGERQVDERLAQKVAEKVMPAYQQILRDDEALLDERGINAELANTVYDGETGDVSFVEAEDETAPVIESDEVEASNLSDPNLIEGEDVAPIIRPRSNRTRQVSRSKNRDTSEARAEMMRQRDPKGKYEATKNKGSWQVVEILGYSDRASAEAAARKQTEGNTDELVGAFDVVEESGQFFVREQIVPDQLTSSVVIQRNPEITPSAPSGQTTAETYVQEVMDDTAFRSQQKRRLQAQILAKPSYDKEKEPEGLTDEQKSQRIQDIEDTITVFQDGDGFEHEVYAPDVASLGAQLLQAEGVASDLNGDSWWEASWTRGVAELRSRGWKPTAQNKNPVISTSKNFTKGTGTSKKLKKVIKSDQFNRSGKMPTKGLGPKDGQQNGAEPLAKPWLTENDELVNPDDAEIAILNAQVTLKRLDEKRKAAKARELEAQKEGAPVEEIAAAKDEVAALTEQIETQVKTLENFLDFEETQNGDPDFVRKYDAVQDIAGRDGVENMDGAEDGFNNPTDQRLQNDGVTPVTKPSAAAPVARATNVTADPVVESDNDPAPRSESPTVAEAASQQRWADKVGDATEQRALDAWLSGDPEQVEVERGIARGRALCRR